MQTMSIPSTLEPPGRLSLIWLIASSLILLALTSVPIDSLINLFHDDSFFYMVIARYHAAGLGYRFDGLNLTNGFHPLWLWLLSVIGSWISLTGEQGIRTVVAVQSVFSIGAALLYVRLLSKCQVGLWVQILFYLAYIALCTVADIGQESALYGFLVAVLLSLIFSTLQTQALRESQFFNSALVIVGGMIVLTRLDSVFLLGGIALALVLGPRVTAKRQALALSLGGALGIVATISFNYWVFGHAYSISSWLKSGFDLSKAQQLVIPGLLVRVVLILGLLGAAVWRYKKAGVFFHLQTLHARASTSFTSFAAQMTGCLLLAYGAYFTVLFLEVSALGSWYFNQALGLAIFFYALTLTKRNLASQSLLSLLPLWAALIIGAALLVMKLMWGYSSAATKQMGEWLNRHTEPKAIIFQRDGAGAVSYFAQRNIINGDGLVNNMQYQVMLRSGRLCEYLKEQGVQYIVSNTSVNTANLIQDYIFLWTKGLSSIPLTNTIPSAAVYTTSALPHYRLFRIEDAGTGCNR